MIYVLCVGKAITHSAHNRESASKYIGDGIGVAQAVGHGVGQTVEGAEQIGQPLIVAYALADEEAQTIVGDGQGIEFPQPRSQ